MVEPPTLSKLSDSISGLNQEKRNAAISEMDPIECDLEPIEKTETDNNIDKSEIAKNLSCEATISVALLLTSKKVKNHCMNMAGCGVIATSDQF